RRIEQEPSVAPEAASTLWTAPTGSVVRDFGSLRPFDLIKQRAGVSREPASSRGAAEALAVQLPAKELPLRRLARTPVTGARLEAVEVNSAPEIWVPAWLFVPNDMHAQTKALLV